MKNKITILLIMMLIGSAYGTNQASALSCGVPLFTEAFARHDLLLHGTLIKKELKTSEYIHQSVATLTFNTIKVYKGEYRETFTIRADLTWDDYYREGVEYVLFADNDGDDYIRELCVGDYIATSSIIEFLDGYPLNMVVGTGVYSLYDLVTGFERDKLDILMERYSSLNRGDEAIRNIAQSGDDFEYTCDFVMDLQESSKYLSNVIIVKNFNEQNPNSTISVEYDLDSDPPTAIVIYEGQKQLAQVSVMNAKELGNCFAVYNSKLIDKQTGEVLREHDNFKSMCWAENSHELLPDLCPYVERPEIGFLGGSMTWVSALYILIISAIIGVPSYIVYRKKRK